DGSIEGNSFGYGFAAGAGVSFRFNLSSVFTLSANLDIYTGSVDDKNDYLKLDKCKFNSVNASLGAHFRF
ncbi:MAG: hypothetical protein LBN11_03215, partial [Tannerella sp.]|nr:hypothetical protein [Tannerella sp.]